jgi:hypothetical protein
MASRAIVDQLMTLLPKDNEQIIGQIKQLYALLQEVMITDPVFAQEAGKRGLEVDHHQHLLS